MLKVFRKEIKYVIPLERFYRFENLLDAVLTRDINGDNGTYAVRSLYFDSFVNQDLHDNIDGVMEKRKIRLRIYSHEDDFAKLEYKCKSGSDSKKYSMRISRSEALEMEKHHYDCLMQQDSDLAKHLYIKMMQGFYRPKSIVEYKRTAFSYPVSDIRITFDTQLRTTKNPYGLFEKELHYIPIMNGDVGVLEVKYNDFIPTQIKTIVSSMCDSPQGFSKYSLSRVI